MKTALKNTGRATVATLAAVMAVGALATPTFAQDYRRGGYGADGRYAYQANCQDIKHQRTTTGGILGALAGAAIGSNLAAHGGGRAGGAVLGAVAGAVVGSNVGRESAKDQCGGYYRDGRYYAYPVRQTSYGYGDNRGYQGDNRAYYGDGYQYRGDRRDQYRDDRHDQRRDDRYAPRYGGDRGDYRYGDNDGH